MAQSCGGDEFVFGVLPVVRSMGVMAFDPCWAEQAHVSQRCELLHVINGTVSLVLADRTVAAGPGDVLLIPAGAAHRDVFDLDAGLEVFIVFFDWAAADAFFARVTHDDLRALDAPRKAEIAHLLARMRDDVRGDSAADRLIAAARLHTALALALRETQRSMGPAPAGGRRRELMLAARRYLDEHFARPITLEEIAQALGVSAFHLSHVFSEESDFTLFAYLTSVRMTRAYALLREGRRTVAEIAYAVGYDNPNYFSKVFRKHFGHPPSTVRDGAKNYP